MAGKDKEIYSQEHLEMFRPTIRTLVYQILQEKLFNLKRAKGSLYKPGAIFVPAEDRIKDLPLAYIALISGESVSEMIRINEETAKLLLSKKTKLVKFDPTEQIVRKGMIYNKESNSFTFGEENE